MTVSGSFDIQLEPQQDDFAPAGRMLINKEYSGALVGKGIGQMISKRTEQGASVYSAIEEFTGTVEGKNGSFTLFHTGLMSATSQELNVIVVEGSGTEELSGITGKLSIHQNNGAHTYTFDYQLK